MGLLRRMLEKSDPQRFYELQQASIKASEQFAREENLHHDQVWHDSITNVGSSEQSQSNQQQ